MRVLGIDPGITRTGYGLIEKDGGLRLLRCGLIDGGGVPPEERLALLEKELAKLVALTKPDLICLEKLFFSKNVKTASVVSEARGVALLVLRRYDVPLLEFTPSEVKAMIAGRGNSSKDDVREAVKMTLGLKDMPGPDDVSDALAIAISGSLTARLRGA